MVRQSSGYTFLRTNDNVSDESGLASATRGPLNMGPGILSTLKQKPRRTYQPSGLATRSGDPRLRNLLRRQHWRPNAQVSCPNHSQHEQLRVPSPVRTEKRVSEKRMRGDAAVRYINGDHVSQPIFAIG
jgi:hypothetical protein